MFKKIRPKSDLRSILFENSLLKKNKNKNDSESCIVLNPKDHRTLLAWTKKPAKNNNSLKHTLVKLKQLSKSFSSSSEESFGPLSRVPSSE